MFVFDTIYHSHGCCIPYIFSGKQEKEGDSKNSLLVEVGPRLSFESAISSNAKSICRASGIDGVTRLEVGGRKRLALCSVAAVGNGRALLRRVCVVLRAIDGMQSWR